MKVSDIPRLLPIITAYANGEIIEYFEMNREWKKIDEYHYFESAHEYRIQPKPKPREWMISSHPGQKTPMVWDGPLLEPVTLPRKMIRVREVLD